MNEPHPKFKANAALLRADHRVKMKEYSSSLHRSDHSEIVDYISRLEMALSEVRILIEALVLPEGSKARILNDINKILPEESNS